MGNIIWHWKMCLPRKTERINSGWSGRSPLFLFTPIEDHKSVFIKTQGIGHQDKHSQFRSLPVVNNAATCNWRVFHSHTTFQYWHGSSFKPVSDQSQPNLRQLAPKKGSTHISRYFCFPYSEPWRFFATVRFSMLLFWS